MTHTKERIEYARLLKELRRDGETTGATILRVFRAQADMDAYVERLSYVFAPVLHWSGPDIVTIIRREYAAHKVLSEAGEI